MFTRKQFKLRGKTQAMDKWSEELHQLLVDDNISEEMFNTGVKAIIDLKRIFEYVGDIINERERSSDSGVKEEEGHKA